MSDVKKPHAWAGVQVSEEEMKRCVARFSDLKSIDKAYVDTLIPGYEREILNVIGEGVTEFPGDENIAPALGAVEGFYLSYVRSKPGTRGALHAHDTEEIFIPIKGEWIIMWGDNEEHQTPLNVADVIVVPPGVYRCFKNVGSTEGVMIGMLSSTKDKPAGRIAWPELVINQVREIGDRYGIGLTPEGDLVRVELQ